MKFPAFGLQTSIFVGAFVALSCAAAFENDNKDVRNSLNNFNASAETDLAIALNCPDTDRSFFGLEFALSGYNILYGYPKEGGRDPGWRSTIFEADFGEAHYTSDCSYILPAGLDIHRTVACITSFSSKESKTAREFEEQLETSATVSGGGWGASFSASASYKQALKKMNDQAAIYVTSDARCLYYTSIMQPGTPPPLSNAFLTYIKDLDVDDTPEKYFDFFENYGTHFVTSIDYGARFTRTHQMTRSAYERISSNGYGVEATASYEGLFSVSGKGSLSDEQRDAVNAFRQDVVTTVSTLGALPNAQGDHNQWASEVKDSPAPVVYGLKSIEELFTHRYFQGISGYDYDKIRQNIIKYKAKENYCETYLEARNPGMSCDVPKEPVCTLPTILYGSFSCKTPLGISKEVPSDGDICTLSCDAKLFVVEAINSVIRCNAFGTFANFDKTPSCKKYGVAHLKAPFGHYQLDHDGAKTLCNLNGLRLATKSELNEAYEQGLELCSCGYVEDSSKGFYPMHRAITGCGSEIGLISCDWKPRKWNAWCHQ